MPPARGFRAALDGRPEGCFIVKDRNGQALAYVYFEDEPGRRAGRLALIGAREHRSEVVLSVLVVVLCRNRIAILSFSAGQRQISLIALFHVLKALRLRSG
jgi:hypothetical protein